MHFMKLIFLTINLFYDMSDIPISWKKINCGLPKNWEVCR
jgi:hypothetical protein